MKKVIPIVIVLLCVAGCAAWFYHHHPRGQEARLTLYGNVDIREVTLGFRVPGKLTKLFYDEGDKVKAGDVVASLDAEPYSNQVTSAQAQVESLRAWLKLRESELSPAQLAAIGHEHALAALDENTHAPTARPPGSR